MRPNKDVGLAHKRSFTISQTQPLHNSQLNIGFLIAELQVNLTWNKANTWLNKFNLTEAFEEDRAMSTFTLTQLGGGGYHEILVGQEIGGEGSARA